MNVIKAPDLTGITSMTAGITDTLARIEDPAATAATVAAGHAQLADLHRTRANAWDRLADAVASGEAAPIPGRDVVHAARIQAAGDRGRARSHDQAATRWSRAAAVQQRARWAGQRLAVPASSR